MPVISEASIATISHQQQAIMECCTVLIAVIATQNAVGITECRAKLSALLHANLADEEAVLNAPIRRMPLASRPAGYRELTLEAADLRSRYSAHVGKWNYASINSDVRGYERDVCILIGDVERHLLKKRLSIPEWVKQINATHQVGLRNKAVE